jgi:co-chaperonin GroES (HSP10)
MQYNFIKMLNNQVLVEPEIVSDTKSSGLVVSQKRVPRKGKIIKMSDDFTYKGIVSKGDWLYFERYTEMRVYKDKWIINGDRVQAYEKGDN